MKLIITGCSGKMGKELIKFSLSQEYKNKIKLISGITSTSDTTLGADLASLVGEKNIGVLITDNLARNIDDADLVIDFSVPEAAIHFAEVCEVHNKAFVSGTTGFSDAQLKKLNQIAKKIPVFWSANMSVAVNLMVKTVELISQKLGETYDIEIMEMHHNKKTDAPSGTALMLGHSAAKGRGIDFAKSAVYTREGNVGARKEGDIGFAVMRGGDIAGEHSVVFAGPGERIEISHKATNRSIFARGAMNAAFWIINQKPGKIYNIHDMIGI